jgi:hypothetical protein
VVIHPIIRNRVLLIVIAAFFLFITPITHAAPSYGTDMPAQGKGIVGYQSNIIFSHDLAKPYGSIQSAQNFLDIAYSIADWLSLEAKIGCGNILWKGGNHPKADMRSGFAGGYGFRVRLLNDAADKIRVVAGFHHISVHPASRILNNDKYQAILDDWQGDLLISRDIGILVPYIGGKGSYSSLISKTNEIDRKNRPPMYYGGAIIGFTIKINKDLSANVEAHFVDETSLSAGLYCAF